MTFGSQRSDLLTRPEENLREASCYLRLRASRARRGGERRFDLAYFHLRDVRSQLDPRLRNLRLKRLTLGFKVRLVFIGPDPNKLVLRPVHPRADNRQADSLVHYHNFLFEMLEEGVHLTLV